MIDELKQFMDTKGVWSLIFAVIISSTFLGFLSFLSWIYQPALIVCVVSLCSMLKKAKVGWAEMVLILACCVSIVLGNPLPIFNSWMRLGLFCLVIIITTPLISSPAIEQFRVRLFDCLSQICVFTGVGSFIAYFLGINYMRSFQATSVVSIGAGFGGLTVQSIALGTLAALGMLRCVYIVLHQYALGIKSSYYLYASLLACFASVLMASSRGAAGAALISVCILLYEKLRHKIGQLIKIVLCLGVLAVPLSPVVEYFGTGLIAKQEANMGSGGTFSSREGLWNDRLDEFFASPFYGVGFSAQRNNIQDYTRQTGIIEPGTSYGAVFAMTGLLGGSMFLFILGRALNRKKMQPISLPQSYLIFFSIHLFVEGYVFAGGNALCFIFWLCIGASCAIKRNYQLNQIII